MKALLLLAGLAGIGAGAWFILRYMGTPPGSPKNDLIIGGAFLVVALICFAVYFFKRFKEEAEEEISITKL
ncbi:MAG TPA: hypothetical protein VNN73_14950 [Blastocatellia bacterium]|nr:hypothetical protein [Blastocatellia bacterium]